MICVKQKKYGPIGQAKKSWFVSRIAIGELRHLAAEKHGIKNAGLLRKPDLLARLKEHFESRHGLELQDEREEGNLEVSPISQTIDKLRSRIKV